MADRFEIHYPRPGQSIPFVQFWAYGKGPAGVGRLTAVFYDEKGNAIAQGDARESPSGRIWLQRFDTQHRRRSLRGRVTLVVRSLTTGRVLGTVRDLILSVTSIGIAYPTDSDLPVQQTFPTWGTTSEPDQHSAELRRGMTAIPGKFISGPPDDPYNFAFEFENIPPETYTLKVYTTNASGEQTVVVSDTLRVQGTVPEPRRRRRQPRAAK